MPSKNENILEAVNKLREAINTTDGVEGKVMIFYSYKTGHEEERIFGTSPDEDIGHWEQHGLLLQHIQDLTRD